VIFVLSKVNWAELGFVLGRLNFAWAIPASALVALLITLLALRWRIFLRQQGLELPFSTIFSLTWAGQFFNSVLPGSTGGDVVKIYQLCRLAPDRKAAAAATVVVDRFSALAALGALVIIALAIDPVPLEQIGALTGSSSTRILCVMVLMVIGALGLWILYRFIRVTHWLGRLQRTMAALRQNLVFNRNLVAGMSMSFGIHCLSFFIGFLFARGLGIGITFFQILLIFPVVLLLVMLPVTVNGHGLREVVLIFYFNHLHITLTGNASVGVRETVVALSVVCVANDLLWSMPGGLWYLLRFKHGIQRAAV
jgi:hypothetical protein